MEPNGLLKYCFRSSGNKKKKCHDKEMTDSINIVHESESAKKKVKLPNSLMGSSRSNINIINEDSDSDASITPVRTHKTKLNHEDFNSFTNPSKKIIGEPENYSDDESESDNSMSGSSADSGMTEDSSEENYETANQERLLKKQQKYDILSKLQQLERRGVTLSKKFSMKSKLHDLQFELKRVTDILDKESGLKFSRKVLMAAVTGIEYANKRFDPVQAKLDGWSESVMENIEDYDRALIRLVDKYSGAVEVAPEIELLMALVGSGFMFHLSKTILQTPVGILSSLGQENPAVLENVMKNVMSSIRPDQINEIATNQKPSNNTFTPPSFDISQLINNKPQVTNDSGSESSYTDDDSEDDDIKLVQVSQDKINKRRR